MGQQKIMFVVGSSSEVSLLNPIWEELRRQGTEEIINCSIGGPTQEGSSQGPNEALRDLGMPFRRLRDYGTMDITEVLKAEQPDVVVVGSDQEFLKRAFVCAANSLRIPTLSFLLGIMSNASNVPRIALKRTIYRLTHRPINILHKYLYLLRTMAGSGWSPFEILRAVIDDIRMAFSVDDAEGRFGCRAIAVAGSWDMRVLIERGVDPDKIFVTGSPTLGALSQVGGSPDTTLLRQDLGIDTQTRVILLLTGSYVEHGHWSPDMRSRFITGIIDSLAPLLGKSTCLVVKIHPVENLHEYQRIVGDGRERVILRKDLRLSDIVSLSDVVIAGYSTTVLEAGILRKPVILLSIFDEPVLFPYVEMGLATGVYHLGDLRAAVETILDDPSAREEALSKADLFLSQNRRSFDGKASARIADLILDMAGSRPGARGESWDESCEISKEAC